MFNFCAISQAFGEGNNTVATVSPNLAANGPLPPSIQHSKIKMEPDGNAFPSPVAAPYWTMFPPPSSPHFVNTTLGCAKQSVNPPVVNSSLYTRRTLTNRFSSVPQKFPAGQVNKLVNDMSGIALASPPTSGTADVPIQFERQENSLRFQEIAVNSLLQRKKHRKKKNNSNVKSQKIAHLSLPKRVSGDGMMMPMIDNSKSFVQSDVFVENSRKKQLICTGDRFPTNSNMIMDVEQTVAPPSHSKPIVDVGLSGDEEIRQSIHQVIKLTFFLVFPLLLIFFLIIRSKKLHRTFQTLYLFRIIKELTFTLKPLKGISTVAGNIEFNIKKSLSCRDSQFLFFADPATNISWQIQHCQAKPGELHNHEVLSQEMLELAVIRWECLLRIFSHFPHETNLQSIEFVVSSWPNQISFSSYFLESKFHPFLKFHRHRAFSNKSFVRKFWANFGEDKVAHFRQVVLQFRSLSVPPGQFLK